MLDVVPCADDIIILAPNAAASPLQPAGPSYPYSSQLRTSIEPSTAAPPHSKIPAAFPLDPRFSTGLVNQIHDHGHPEPQVLRPVRGGRRLSRRRKDYQSELHPHPYSA